MIIYLLLMLFSSLLYLVVSLIPTIETPLWILNNLPVIIHFPQTEKFLKKFVKKC